MDHGLPDFYTNMLPESKNEMGRMRGGDHSTYFFLVSRIGGGSTSVKASSSSPVIVLMS